MQLTLIESWLGVFLALGNGVRLALLMRSCSMCTLQDVPGIAMAVAAGSSMISLLAKVITRDGLGNGVSFIFMVNIAGSARPRSLNAVWHSCCVYALRLTCALSAYAEQLDC